MAHVHEPSDLHSMDKFLRRLCGVLAHKAEADDLAQEVWLRVLRTRCRPKGPVDPWLRGIARNTQRYLARSVRARVERELRQQQVAHQDWTYRQVEARSLRERLESLVDELRTPYRQLIRERYLEERSVEEIATRTGRKSATISVQLSRGLRLLRHRLDGTRWSGAID